MKKVFKIVGKILKVYVVGNGIGWALVGIGNYLDDTWLRFDEHKYIKGDSRKIVDEHIDCAIRGISRFCKEVKEVVTEKLEGLF